MIHHAPAGRGAGLSKPATRVRFFSRWTGRAGSVLTIPHPGYRTMHAPREIRLEAAAQIMDVSVGARRLAPSIGERVGAELEMEGDRNRALAAFLEPRRPVAARRPHPAAFPSCIGVVDAAVEPLGIKA